MGFEVSKRSGGAAALPRLCTVVGEVPSPGLLVDRDFAVRLARAERAADGPRTHRFADLAQPRVDRTRCNAVRAFRDEFLENSQHEIDAAPVGTHMKSLTKNRRCCTRK